MDSNKRFDQLEGLMADMLRRMDQMAGQMGQMAGSIEQLAASQERTNTILDGVVEVLKLTDHRFQRVEDALLRVDQRQQKMEDRLERVEDALLRADQRQQKVEERQEATLRLLGQQSENLTAAFRSLESHDGRLRKLEDDRAA